MVALYVPCCCQEFHVETLNRMALHLAHGWTVGSVQRTHQSCLAPLPCKSREPRGKSVQVRLTTVGHQFLDNLLGGWLYSNKKGLLAVLLGTKDATRSYLDSFNTSMISTLRPRLPCNWTASHGPRRKLKGRRTSCVTSESFKKLHDSCILSIIELCF